MYSCPEFQIAIRNRGCQGRGRDPSELRWSSQAQIGTTNCRRILRLEMIEDVRELQSERHTNALRKSQVFGERRVQVPAIQPADVSDAATARINAQDTAPEIGPHRGRVSK